MHQDWLWGLGGGIGIGLAAAGYLLLLGRIMGMSGIMGGLIDGTGWGDWGERLAFCAGLVVVPGLLALGFGGATHLTQNWLLIVAGGLLVGFGTRLANGCTSGHGVCGLSRLSRRGIVASLTYVLAGMATITLLRHLWGAM